MGGPVDKQSLGGGRVDKQALGGGRVDKQALGGWSCRQTGTKWVVL